MNDVAMLGFEGRLVFEWIMRAIAVGLLLGFALIARHANK